MTAESHKILSALMQAKDEVKKLEAEYRKVCACNTRIEDTQFDAKSYQKLYKTCHYHEVKFTRAI